MLPIYLPDEIVLDKTGGPDKMNLKRAAFSLRGNEHTLFIVSLRLFLRMRNMSQSSIQLQYTGEIIKRRKK